MSSDFTKIRAVFYKEFGSKPPWPCLLCGRAILINDGRKAYSLAVHHIDGDHRNNDPKNLAPTHYGCHSTFHHLSEETWTKLFSHRR